MARMDMNENSGNDYMLGGTGNDSLLGQHGDDNMNGEWGNDYLIGGFGNEVFRLAITPDGQVFSCSADKTARSPPSGLVSRVMVPP